jgi:hypothetical protein
MTKPSNASRAEAGSGWLALTVALPTEDPAMRMRVLRTLESLGAAVLREGVFLLPDSAVNRQALERLADYITKNSGTAYVLQVSAGTPAQQEKFRALFDRSTRYEQLAKVVSSLKVGFGVSDPSAISRVLHKQRDEFDLISALDFFPSEARARAEKTLAEAEAVVKKLLFPIHQQSELKPGDKLLGRIWATRKPLWADRLACAWLIRRFVDPEATLVWLDKQQECPPRAVGFAFDRAHFVNSPSRVTFEEMLSRLNFANNAALVKIGGIVHYLEVGGSPVPEAAGVETLLLGAVRRSAGEDELMREAEKTFDLLFEAYEEPIKQQ